jgi:hypothetical protein
MSPPSNNSAASARLTPLANQGSNNAANVPPTLTPFLARIPQAGQSYFGQAGPQEVQALLSLMTSQDSLGSLQGQQVPRPAPRSTTTSTTSSSTASSIGGDESPPIISAGAGECKHKKTSAHDPKSGNVINCGAKNCNKSTHYECYKTQVLQKYSVPPIVFPVLEVGGVGGESIVCSKTCYNKELSHFKKIQKQLQDASDEAQRVPWHNDGKNGEEDPNTSEKILIDWWTEGTNYSQYRGSKRGLKKVAIAEMLANKMNKAGVRCVRTGKQVLNKIAAIEDNFRKAHDFAHSETGAGLKETDEGTFNEALQKKCKYYFDLKPIIQDRASAKALLTSDDIADDTGTISSSSSEDNSFDSTDDDDDCEGGDDGTLDDHAKGNEAGSVGGDAGTSNDSILDSDDDTEGGSNVVPMAASKKKEPKKKPAKKTRKPVKKTRMKGKVDIGMESSVVRLENMKRQEIKETKRHNKRMEKIEADRQEWKMKHEKLEYLSALHEKYEDVVSKGWPKEKIVKFFPDMEQFIDKE